MMRKISALIVGLVGAVGLVSAATYATSSTPKPIIIKHVSAAVKPQPVVPVFNKAQFSTTDPASIWVVVNKQHPLPSTYIPAGLASIGNGELLRSDAAAALNQMIADAHTASNLVVPESGYRSYATQVQVYNAEVKTNGQATADSESARPGFSEHQTGLAVDLGTTGCSIATCFATVPAGQWVTANAYKYGFILRYPSGSTAVTGYTYEPWHFRFVGVALATELHNDKVPTLEQFFNVSGGTNYSTN